MHLDTPTGKVPKFAFYSVNKRKNCNRQNSSLHILIQCQTIQCQTLTVLFTQNVLHSHELPHTAQNHLSLVYYASNIAQ